jgi:hypothetical protein
MKMTLNDALTEYLSETLYSGGNSAAAFKQQMGLDNMTYYSSNNGDTMVVHNGNM